VNLLLRGIDGVLLVCWVDLRGGMEANTLRLNCSKNCRLVVLQCRGSAAASGVEGAGRVGSLDSGIACNVGFDPDASIFEPISACSCLSSAAKH
jgi:hypothetical protein